MALGGAWECTALVEVDGVDAEAIVTALEPDNATAPQGVEARCRVEGGRVSCVVRVSCGNASGILRLRNTLDDLILNLRAALEALEGGKG